MKLNRKNLLTALKSVQPGLASKEIIEQSTSFIFRDGYVFTCNDEIAVRHPIEDKEIEGAVPSKEFYALLSKLKQDEIDLEISDKEFLIKQGRSKYGIRREAEIVLPIDEIKLPVAGDWKELPEDFIKALKLCVPSAGADMSMSVLTNVFCDGNTMIASDNYKISQYIFDADFKFDPVLIPAVSCRHLLKYNPTHYVIDETWIHFFMDTESIFSCRRAFETDYPDLLPFLDVKGLDFQFPENIKDILDTAEIFSKSDFEQDAFIAVAIKDNQVIFKAQGDNGWSKEPIRIRYADDPIEFQVNPDIFKSILEHSYSMIIGSNCMLFGTEQFKHLVMLGSEI